jgi:hypothetical protein
MNDDKKRTWDVWLGAIGPLLTVATILIGVHQFNVGERERQQEQVHQEEVDFQRKAWLERMNAYRSVAELAGKVIAHIDDKKGKDAIRDFEAAYWGTMILVEDKAVEKAMVDFFVEIEDYEKGWSTVDRLKVRDDELIKACQQSVLLGPPKS